MIEIDDFPPWAGRFFAALWISEGWYESWRQGGPLHRKARGIVMFDRILCGEEKRARRE